MSPQKGQSSAKCEYRSVVDGAFISSLDNARGVTLGYCEFESGRWWQLARIMARCLVPWNEICNSLLLALPVDAINATKRSRPPPLCVPFVTRVLHPYLTSCVFPSTRIFAPCDIVPPIHFSSRAMRRTTKAG